MTLLLTTACAPWRPEVESIHSSDTQVTGIPSDPRATAPTPALTRIASAPATAAVGATSQVPPTVTGAASRPPTATAFPVRAAAGNGQSGQPLPLVATGGRVSIAARPTKISQLIGDYDAERQQPTLSRTLSRFKLESTDLGIPFTHKGRTYLLFGDSVGAHGGDAIAYTTDTSLDNGLTLNFLQEHSGTYKPIIIPGIRQDAFEVPSEGVSVGGGMYVYHTTDASSGPKGEVMGRSVVALSTDDGQTFRYLYDLSRQSFINVSIVTVDVAQWEGIPSKAGQGLVMFGSGDYRRSNVSLAFQPASAIGTSSSMRYWSGLDASGAPTWSDRERDARPLFNQPCVGEFSVSYNRFISKWIMLYNCDNPRGINMRIADRPWGPWGEPTVLFDPWADGGYCHYMHVPRSFSRCDLVQGPGQEQIWGGEYGPYQFEDYAVGSSSSTTIYFTMSTWNPYTVVLMKATLRLEP